MTLAPRLGEGGALPGPWPQDWGRRTGKTPALMLSSSPSLPLLFSVPQFPLSSHTSCSGRGVGCSLAVWSPLSLDCG